MMKRFFILMCVLLFMGTTLLGQQIRVSGTVTDASEGASLPGVTITVAGTTAGTVTDINGRYEIPAAPDAVLVFSFIGMRTQEVPVNGRTLINVALESEMVGLEEVIVIAYGTTRRESFTGVADVISAEKIERRQVSNITKALEGVAPGIQTTSGGGQPGSSAQIRLRGFGSISADNAPLFVVDGMPFSGNLNAINPDDIASITVLRDASAAALYGSRGANGVIMITTKRGDERRPSMSFTSRVGFTDRVIPEYPRVSSEEFMLITWEALRNAAHFGAQGLAIEDANVQAMNNLTPTVGYYRPFRVPDGENLIQWDNANPWVAWVNPNAQLLYQDDWQEELFGTALRQDYQFNVSGGTGMSDYFLSFGYLNEDGLAIESGFERISGRLNVNTQPTSWFETGLNLSTSFSETVQQAFTGTQTSNAFYFSRMMPPIYPIWVRDNDGNLVLDENGDKILDYGFGIDPNLPSDHPDYRNRPYAGNANLLGSLTLDDRSFKRENIGARTYALFNIMDGLTFRTNLSADYYSLYQTNFQNPQFGDAANVQGRGTKTFNRSYSVTFNQLLNYARQFGNHNFDILLGHESYRLLFNTLSSTRTTFPIPGITELGIATTTTDATSRQDEYTIEGYFTRLSYDYNNRYYISGSYRRDGTSRFYVDNRWGNFFSLGLSWRVTQEDFMKGIDWLDNLRIKASYGEQGNDAIGPYYAWQSFYSLGDWNNAGLSGAVYSTHENRDLVWESSNNTNLGFDFTVFDRVTAEFDYFIRESSNLLFNVPLPPSTGVTSIRRNIGAMENRGIEFRLMADIVRQRDFRWNIDFNITHLKNEITKMPEQTPEIITGNRKLMEGVSLYEFYLRETSRIDPETGAQYYFYDVLDDDGNVIARRDTTLASAATRYYVGNAIPDFWGGITNSFNYRNFDLAVLLTYSYGGLMYDGTYASLVAGRLWATDYGNHYHVDALNRWVQPGDETGQARLEGGNPDLYAGTSADNLFETTYLALKNITIGYTLPQQLLNQVGLKNLRLFVSGDNLLILNSNQGMDPQHSFSGATDFGYIPVRTVTFGLNMQF